MSYLPPLIAFGAVLLGVIGSKSWDGNQPTWWRRVRPKGWIALALGVASLALGLRAVRAAEESKAASLAEAAGRAETARQKIQAACNPLNRLLVLLASGAIRGPQDTPPWLPQGHNPESVFDGREKSLQIADFLLSHLDGAGSTDLRASGGMGASGRSVSRAVRVTELFASFESAANQVLAAFAAHLRADQMRALLEVKDDGFARTLRERCAGLVRGDPFSTRLLPPSEDRRAAEMRAGLETWVRRIRDLSDRHGAPAGG